MGNKNKTISFRVNEDAFETLREIAEERNISLSAVFRDYDRKRIVREFFLIFGIRARVYRYRR